MEEEKDLLAELDKEISNLKPEEETPKEEKSPEIDREKEFKSLDAQKRAWRDKAEKLEKQLQERPGEKGDVNPMEVVKLAQALKDHDEDEIDFIVRNAKSSRAEDIIKASKDEMVELAIEAKRKKKAAEKKVPGSGDSELGSKQKDWKDIQKMSKEDFQKFEEQELRTGGGNI